MFCLLVSLFVYCSFDGPQVIFRDFDYPRNKNFTHYGDYYVHIGDNVAGKNPVEPMLFHNMVGDFQRSLFRNSFQLPNSTYVPATFILDLGARFFLCFSRLLWEALYDVEGFFIREGKENYVRIDKKYKVEVSICYDHYWNGNIIGVHLLWLWC